jgi:hypothetical protein
VLFVCFNRALREELRRRGQGDGVKYQTFHSLCVELAHKAKVKLPASRPWTTTVTSTICAAWLETGGSPRSACGMAAASAKPTPPCSPARACDARDARVEGSPAPKPPGSVPRMAASNRAVRGSRITPTTLLIRRGERRKAEQTSASRDRSSLSIV